MVTRLFPYLYCCLCFEKLEPEDCFEENGKKVDVCKPCGLREFELLCDMFEAGYFQPRDWI